MRTFGYTLFIWVCNFLGVCPFNLDAVYETQCAGCSASHICQTRRRQVSVNDLQEHKEAVKTADFNASDSVLAEHARPAEHLVDWPECRRVV